MSLFVELLEPASDMILELVIGTVWSRYFQCIKYRMLGVVDLVTAIIL